MNCLAFTFPVTLALWSLFRASRASEMRLCPRRSSSLLCARLTLRSGAPRAVAQTIRRVSRRQFGTIAPLHPVRTSQCLWPGGDPLRGTVDRNGTRHPEEICSYVRLYSIACRPSGSNTAWQDSPLGDLWRAALPAGDLFRRGGARGDVGVRRHVHSRIRSRRTPSARVSLPLTRPRDDRTIIS